MDIRNLEDKMNDYIINMDEHDLFVFDNIEFFYSLNFQIIKLLDRKYKKYDASIDINKISKISFYEIIELLKKFYKSIGLDFDLDKLYNEGNIEYKFYDYDDVNVDSRFKLGMNFYNPIDMHKDIIVCNNGIISDAIILSHELSHYRNQNDGGRSVVGRFFTETLALTDELIFYDYLLKNNYKIDSNFFKSCISFFYNNALETISVMELIILYKNLGSLKLNDFQSYFNTNDDYDVDINIFMDMPEDYSLIATASYEASILVAPYLFYKYKKDKNYEYIEKFNELIMKYDTSLYECFKYLGLNELDDSDIKKLSKSINKLKKEYLK